MFVFMVLFTLIIYGLINFYVGSRILIWLRLVLPVLPTGLFWVIYLFLALSIFIGYFIPISTTAKIIRQISNYWLGAFLYLLLCITLVDILRLAGKHTKIWSVDFLSSPRVLAVVGILIMVVVLTIVSYGLHNTKQIKLINYDLSIDKQINNLHELNIVLISDLHLGHMAGKNLVTKIVDTINQLDADIVCIAGDVFDNDFATVPDISEIEILFQNLQSRYGVFACLGNHDVTIHKPQNALFSRGKANVKSDEVENSDIVNFFANAGITLLQDEYILVDNAFYIVGQKDASPIGITNYSRKKVADLTSKLDFTKAVILLDHQPRELANAKDNGVDLLLSGHTHGGQVFPGNLVTKRLFEVGYGYLQKGEFHTIVTSGVGTWGPPMRLLTNCEVVNIHVKFR